MKVVTWNVRGLGSDANVLALRRLLKDQRVEMALIQETKKSNMVDSDIQKFWWCRVKMSMTGGRIRAAVLLECLATPQTDRFWEPEFSSSPW
ncbi:hypothetical protein V6N11_033908 [Hibiscus sabdariffa]|uniref:Endonuclease/exonuclease/phosphatase domain-containing protein n=1 Tax=Hibiscus sabdariffa TaxID=183260 RepID=A0ABR2S1S4_9ROSI